MTAVKQSWYALEYASIRLKKDKEIVLAAVKQNWRGIEFASKEMKRDPDVMIIVVRQHDFYHAFPQRDLFLSSFGLQMFRYTIYGPRYNRAPQAREPNNLLSEINNNKTVMMVAVQCNVESYQVAPEQALSFSRGRNQMFQQCCDIQQRKKLLAYFCPIVFSPF